jgi:hypothetical protein
MTHGVAGTSANATGNRRRAATRKRTTTSTRRPRRTSTTRGNGAPATVDRNALLRTLFPTGIPPREDVIDEVNAWLDQAERLARTR